MPAAGLVKRRAAGFCVALGLALCVVQGHAENATPWSTAWAAAMLPSPVPASAVRATAQIAPLLHGQTLRQMVTLSAGGRRIRIRLSNAFGTQPLRIDAASVGERAAGGRPGRLDAATLHALRFDGRPAVVLPPGTARYSDPLELPVHGGDTLGISLYVAGEATPTTWHPDARRDNFISPRGDYTAAATMPVASTTGAALWLSGVDVQADEPLPVLVALGDSITNGFQSTPGANRSYPQALARRLRGLHPACRVAVANAGIDGNEISDRDGGYGPGDSMQRRFARDVAGQSGARFVLLLGGINDIGETTMALRPHGRTLDGKTIAANVIAAQRQIIAQAHTAGLRIIGATLPPFEGTWSAYSAAGEQARRQVNDWIRQHAGFDGVADFDAALRDPAHPARLRPDLDSGDHIHPNDHGYAVMAKAVPTSLLGCGQ